MARTFGVKSAMPIFEALRLCPQAKVIRPNMEKYVRVGREVRRMMLALTPLVEPLSIDEAFLDLSGTERLHGMTPAKALARFAGEVEKTVGITVSIGLSGNKFLAKIASDLDKPRGFAVLGVREAQAFLAPKPVGFIFGVGKASAARLARDGFRRIADLQKNERDRAGAPLRRGRPPPRPARPRHRRSARSVPIGKPRACPRRPRSNATYPTSARCERILWGLTEEVSARLKAKELAGSTVTLKLKTADFRHTHARPVAADRRRNSPAGYSPPRATCCSAKPTARDFVCLAWV